MATIYIDDQPMNGVNAVLEALSIDRKLVPQNRRKEFKVPTRVDKEGNIRSKRSIGGIPEYSVFIPKMGRNVKIRLAESQVKDKDKISYQPKSISMLPQEGGLALIDNELEFLFWFIRPMNRQSPLRKPNRKVEYEFVDPHADAERENEIEEKRIMALSIIYGETAMNRSQLTQLAKGLGIDGVDDMTLDIVKQRLRKIAYANPEQFMNQAESREIIFSGKIQDALDKGVIQARSLNGMERWYLNGKEIMPIPYGADKRNVLDRELAINWHLYAQEIQDSLDNKTVSTALNSPEFDHLFTGNVDKIEVKADANRELIDQYKSAMTDDDKARKIKEMASWDINDPSLHHMKKKAYNDNIGLINLYKESLKTTD